MASRSRSGEAPGVRVPRPSSAGRQFRVPARRHLVFAVISLALLMSSIDTTIVAVALQHIRADLHTNVVWEGWTITAYQLGQLLVMPIAGKLSDEWGRKRVFLAAIALFTISSLLCGIAPNVYLLVLFRVLQAIGGGSFMPSCTGIVSDLYQQNRAKAIGLFTSIFPIGGILGPNIGGVIVDHISWRFVFWVNVPLGILVIALTGLLYSDKAPSVRRKIDFAGAGIYSVAIMAMLFALTWLGESPRAVHNPILWGMMLLFPVLLVVFFRWEQRSEDPIIAPVLLQHRPFLAANLYNLFFGAGAFGVMAFIPTYFQVKYGLSATGAGALLTPRAIGMIVTSTIAALYIIRLGYRWPMIVGISMQSLSVFLLSRGFHHVQLFGFELQDAVWLALVMALAGMGLGTSQPAANNAAIDLLPGKVAAVTGIRNTFRLTGGLLGTAIIVLIRAHYTDNEAVGLQRIFLGVAILNFIPIALTFWIPDRARERRRRHPPGGGPSENTAAAEPVVASALPTGAVAD